MYAMFVDQTTSIRKFPLELLLIAPLLALTNSTLVSFSTGLIFSVLLLLIAVSVTAVRSFIAWQVRLPMLILIAATCVSLLDMLLTAWFFELRQQLGIYLPLLAINSLVFSVSEEYYLRMPLRQSLVHALRVGGVVLLLLIVTGIIREILTYGSLLHDAGLILTSTENTHPATSDNGTGLILIGKAPGGFFCLGLVFGLWNYLMGNKQSNMSEKKQGHAIAIE